MGMWDQNQYVIKQKVLTLGRKYFIYDSRGALIGFCKQKMFKMKEDIRIFAYFQQWHGVYKQFSGLSRGAGPWGAVSILFEES
jgi:hypothetical protein